MPVPVPVVPVPPVLPVPVVSVTGSVEVVRVVGIVPLLVVPVDSGKLPLLSLSACRGLRIRPPAHRLFTHIYMLDLL